MDWVRKDGTDGTDGTTMNTMTEMTDVTTMTSPTTSPEIERRIGRLERTNRILMLALTGAIGIGAGAAMVGAQRAASPPPPPVQKQVASNKLVSIVLDPSRSSGRWNSTLLAVDSEGVVYSLDTSRPQSVWGRFQFSP